MDKNQNPGGEKAKSTATSTAQASTINASTKSNNSNAGSFRDPETASSNYKIVKEGWGSRSNFQASFGLKMDPDGIEEGNAILEAFKEQDQRR